MYSFIIMNLLFFALADNTVNSTCQPCDQGNCLVFNGGPFNFYEILLVSSNASDTQSAPVCSGEKITIDFLCQSNCSGCEIKAHFMLAGSAKSMCYEQPTAERLINQLNQYYQQSNKLSTNETYNWCNCSQKQQTNINNTNKQSQSKGIAVSDPPKQILVESRQSNESSIVAIVLGSVAGAVLIGITIYCLCRKKGTADVATQMTRAAAPVEQHLNGANCEPQDIISHNPEIIPQVLTQDPQTGCRISI